jgi:hypothetical protein
MTLFSGPLFLASIYFLHGDVSGGSSALRRVWTHVVANQCAEGDVHPVPAIDRDDRQRQIDESLLVEVLLTVGSLQMSCRQAGPVVKLPRLIAVAT